MTAEQRRRESSVAGAGAPWWASGADDLDPDVDPFRAHREARSAQTPWEPPSAHDPPRPDGATRSLLEEAVEGIALLGRLAGARRDRAHAGERGPAAAHPRDGAACRGCAWCTLLRAVEGARPEVVEHLGEAVRHLTLAARALVDAADERGEWESIPLDDDGGSW